MNNVITQFRKIGYDSYSDYLNSRHWTQLRRLYWESGQPQCCRICESKKQLIIHHRRYETLGHENIYKDVVMLCQPCHDKVHFFADQKTPLVYKHLVEREEFLYKQHRKVTSRLLRFRLGTFLNQLYLKEKWRNP